MTHPLFVYGTLMKDMPNHGFLTGAKFICQSETMAKYLMTANFIPFITPEEKVFDSLYKSKLSRVKGELYEVTEEQLQIIDRLEGHPTFYKRVLRECNSPEDWVNAWIYECPYPEGTVIPDGNYKSYLRMRENYSQHVQANR